MLRGNYTARIDEKGRLKIPTHFRRKIEEKYNSNTVYLTSLTGESVQIFPLKEWENIEQRLALLPTNDAARIIYVTGTSFWGQESEIDNQGRILIHPLLRRKADAFGDVAVLGSLTYLNVWNMDRIERFMTENPFTEEHGAMLARLGI